MTEAMSNMEQPPLVAHLIYRLDIGGLETLLVDAINRMPAHKYRHVVICLTDYTDFAERITRPGVAVHALHKPPGLGLGAHARLFKLLRRLRPAVLHTYNLGTIEYHATALLAGVPVRVHAEHGRDAGDPHGVNRKHNLLRRLLVPVIDRFVPVSRDLDRWLQEVVGIPAAKTLLIDNGVDTERFRPASDTPPASDPAEPWSAAAGSSCGHPFVIGAVGRLQDVKHHAGLIEAFALLRHMLPEQSARLRLVLVGDGPLRARLEQQVAAAGLQDCVWLAGARSDVAPVMRSFSLFALSSIAEGTPVTMLEAMASGLPVVSTAVGGIPDLVLDGATGTLVPPRDPQRMAEALASYVRDQERARLHGSHGRERIERKYSIAAMLATYVDLYDGLCRTKTPHREVITQCAE
ncbi:TIGR03088 family PEP-CTERM/XrtA system glycosyltransferase [Massilia sp. LXY-6]|uniref:TIGR03088 family PEP-CTERM/XrtA system glycosyltransferase n=1 Tax=Massilia sp. LXY-6 TaxID=3379823 RepID=UPI003EDFE61D